MYTAIKQKRLLILPIALLCYLFVGICFFFVPASAQTQSRLQYCQNYQPQSAADECLNKLNLDAWNACISKPEAERGACAETYKNGEAATAGGGGKNNQPPESAPEPITNAEREALVDCGGNGEAAQVCLEKNPLVKWTVYAINFFAAGVGIVVTIMIIIGGIQYASAGSNPQAVHAAKLKISNAIIALLAFFFLYAFLQYLIPGGIF